MYLNIIQNIGFVN